MKLYGALASPYVARVVLFAQLKGIELPLEAPPGGSPATPDYRAFTPIAKIPSLDVDGHCIPESETICEYIQDLHPDKPGMPADALASAQSRTISRIVDLYMSPISADLARNVNPERRDEAIVEKNVEVMAKVASQLEFYMGDGPFAVGNEPTLGDCALGPHMAMFKILVFDNFDSIDDPTLKDGRLKVWWDAMQGHEKCGPLLDEYSGAFEKMMAYFR